MNRQEAIKVLKGLLDCSYVDSFEPEENEALQIAISSLETEPCEDCISRKEAFEALNNVLGIWGRKVLMELPSVTAQEPREITLEDVKGYCKPRCLTIITNELLYELTHPKTKALEQEPKTGHWIDDTKYGGTECSECGKWYPHATIAKNEIKYCSECGAKMIEPQESEG